MQEAENKEQVMQCQHGAFKEMPSFYDEQSGTVDVNTKSLVCGVCDKTIATKRPSDSAWQLSRSFKLLEV